MRRKRPGPPVINPRHPMARGLAMCLCPWEGGGAPNDDLTKSLGFGPSEDSDATVDFPSYEETQYGQALLFEGDHTVAANSIRWLSPPPNTRLEYLKEVRNFTAWGLIRCDDTSNPSMIFTDDSVSNSWGVGHDNQGRLTFAIWGAVILNSGSGNTINDGWHDIAWVAYDSSIEFYVDGEFLASTANSSSLGASASGWRFGCQAAQWEAFAGAIVDFRVYDYRLSDAEIGGLHVDPFALYEPDYPVLIAPPASGGVNLTQPAVETIAISAFSGSVSAALMLTQPAVETIEFAALSGSTNIAVGLTQTAVEALELAAFSGTVSTGLGLTQTAVETLELAALSGTVSANITLTQTAVEALELAALSGTVARAVTLTQTAVATIELAALSGSVTVSLVIAQTAVETIELAAFSGTVDTGAAVVQTAPATLELAAFSGTVTDPTSLWDMDGPWIKKAKPPASTITWNADHELASSIVVALPMDEGSGSTLNDASGNGNHATIGTGAVGEDNWLTAEEGHNPCVRADITLPASVSAGLDSTFSWGLLCKIVYEPLLDDDGVGDYGEVRHPLSKNESASDIWADFRLTGYHNLSSSEQLRPRMFATIAGTPTQLNDDAQGPDWPDINNSQWLHWHFTFDKDSEAKLYTNGVLHSTYSGATGLMDLSASTALSLISDFLSADSSQWLAYVADFKLGDRVWSERECFRDYNNPWDLYTVGETLIAGTFGETEIAGMFGETVLGGIFGETVIPGSFRVCSTEG